MCWLHEIQICRTNDALIQNIRKEGFYGAEGEGEGLFEVGWGAASRPFVL